jgi:hypothetical protein
VDTTSIVLSTSYDIIVTGALASPGPSTTESFTLTLTGCDQTVITTVPISDQAFTVNDVVNTFTFTDWSESLGTCIPFTYTATLGDGVTAVPSFLTLDSSTQTFTVDTSALVLTTSYTIMVTGTLAYPGSSSSTTFTLTITACDSTTITTEAISDTSFSYNEAANTYSISAWSESLGRCSPFTYTAIQVGGAALPSLISFDSTNLIFTVTTSDIVVTTVYDIEVDGSLALGSQTGSVTF